MTTKLLDDLDRKRRKKSLKQTQLQVRAMLANLDGLRRLRQISDIEWQEAEAKDGERLDQPGQ